MNINRFALHLFSDELSLDFNPVEYSKFKFGSKYIARKYGTDLAEAFIESKMFKNMVQAKLPIVVMSSPYINIPTATFAMKDYFIKKLNYHLYLNKLDPCSESKIHRRSSYSVDYGLLSATERLNIMHKDEFTTDSSYLIGKSCIFLDDILITGAHESLILKMLNRYNLLETSNYYFLYYASLTSKDTAPQIENTLNYGFVKSLDDIDVLVNDSRGFIFNTRVIKYILAQDIYQFTKFINKQSEVFNYTLYSFALSNSYNTLDLYHDKFLQLETILNLNKLK